ncbi:MAG: hypothetical protein ACTHNA_11810 [Sphingopyxis terrae]|uniref:hypothetical protein n=1 Tax=Sphingopyxis terrae TaxID=33052 RepID=UPI003F7E1A9D
MSRVWSGQASLEKRLKGITSARGQKMLGAVLFEAVEDIATYAGKSITTGSVSGKNHVASKPGEPPNSDTHVLDRSIGAHHLGPLEKAVIVTAPYASALEGGSQREAGTTSRSFAGKTTPYGPNRAKQGPVKIEYGDSKTEARPFLRPARDARKKAVRKRFAEQVERIVQGAAD